MFCEFPVAIENKYKHMKPTLLILAAGMGSRYGGLKQMDRVGPSGATIIDYSMYDAIKAGFGKIVFVIRRDIENEFRELFINKLRGKVEADYVFQDIDKVPQGISYNHDRRKPWGTAHAVLAAREAVSEPFAVINADDFYGRHSFQVMMEFLMDEKVKGEMAMVGFRLDKTLSEHGKVSRGVCRVSEEHTLVHITERTDIENSPEGIRFLNELGKPVYLSGEETVSMNFWGFRPWVFDPLKGHFSDFLKQYGHEPQKEYYIPDMVMALIGQRKVVKVLNSGESWFGVTYRDDTPVVESRIRELVEQGVYPASLWEG